jgi:class 3 adenylate cyclase
MGVSLRSLLADQRAFRLYPGKEALEVDDEALVRAARDQLDLVPRFVLERNAASLHRDDSGFDVNAHAKRGCLEMLDREPRPNAGLAGLELSRNRANRGGLEPVAEHGRGQDPDPLVFESVGGMLRSDHLLEVANLADVHLHHAPHFSGRTRTKRLRQNSTMREERRLLTVLFADVVGSTELGSQTDPEVLRQQMTRYYERMKEVAETHGGMVEKFIGDAVMVVFGVPRIHDDDAERAVRCGLAMQEAMAELSQELQTELTVRVGINSGEAVVRSGDDGQFIVGDAVNVAARLQQNAEAGEIIAGPLTEQLTRAAVAYERRAPILAKGKTAPLKAFRALRATTSIPRQFRGVPGLRAPLIGRERELQLIVNTFSRVVEDRQAYLFTLLGAAGIGKSRLIEEGLLRMATDFSPHVLQGRCLPYGNGITYWPFIEIVREDAGISLEDDRETAVAKLHQRLASLALPPEQARAVERRLAVVLGVEAADAALPDVPAARVNAELAWAIRRHIETLAAENPVVVVVDDLQWAEPAILVLIEQVTQRSTSVPVLWVCVARPEFLETHPQWGAGRSNTSLITLNPLNPAETSTLISRLLEVEDIPPALHQRLLERSEGNPLFCEEFLRMLIDDGQLLHVEQRWRAEAGAEEIRVPESIQALLAARLDSLPDAQKETLKAASVVGERFTAEQIGAVGGDVDPTATLEDLLRTGLVLEEAAAADSGGFRFKHLLVRDMAYSALSKKDRGDLHERFARHLEQVTGDRADEYGEIIAYHADRAYVLAREMRLPAEIIRPRAQMALRWNLFLAERARSRDDWSVVEQRIASATVTIDDLHGDDLGADGLRLRVLEADRHSNLDQYDAAVATAAEVVQQATGIERWDLAAAAQLCLARIEQRRDPSSSRNAERIAEAARLFRLAGDPVGELETEWMNVLGLLGNNQWPSTFGQGESLAERAASLNEPARAAYWFSMLALFAAKAGQPQHARRYIARATALVMQGGVRSATYVVVAQATLEMLSDDLERASQRVRDAIAAEEYEGYATIFFQRTLSECLTRSGALVEADAVLDDALKRSEKSGELWNRCELFAKRAVIAVRSGDLVAAERYVRRSLETALPGDVSGAVESNWALAELRAAQGRNDEADAAYSRIMALSADYYDVLEEVDLSFARFLISRGRGREAVPVLDRIEGWLDASGYSTGRAEIAELRQRTA